MMKIHQVSLLTLVVMMASMAQPVRAMEEKESEDHKTSVFTFPFGCKFNPPYQRPCDRVLVQLDALLDRLSQKETKKKEKVKEKDPEENKGSKSISTTSFSDLPQELLYTIFPHIFTEKGFGALENFFNLMQVNRVSYDLLTDPSFLHQTLLLSEPLYRLDGASSSEGKANPVKARSLFIALNRAEGFSSRGNVEKATQVLIDALSYHPNSRILPTYLASYKLRHPEVFRSIPLIGTEIFVEEKMAVVKAFFSQALQEDREKKAPLNPFNYGVFIKFFCALPNRNNSEDEEEKRIWEIYKSVQEVKGLEQLPLPVAQVRLVVLLSSYVSDFYKKRCLSEFAIEGDLESQFVLAEYYRTGRFNLPVSKELGKMGEENFNNAFKWYTVMKDNKNNPDAKIALFRLGMAHWYGDFFNGDETFIPKNIPLGFEYFTKAARQGYAPAQYQLAKCYLRGEGNTSLDGAQGFHWLIEAARKGHVDAQYDLSMSVVHTDQDDAMRWLEKAAKQGHQEAAQELARMIETTLTPQAQAGDPHKQYKLGLFYLLGLGVPKDEVKGVEWLTQAAKKGYSPAQFELARSHLQGRGVPKIDVFEAFKWLEQAIKLGHKQAYQELNHYIETDLIPEANKNINATWAQYRLSHFYLSGLGIPKNETLGIDWLTRSADGGFEVAQCELGKRYVRGEGCVKDKAKGIDYLHRALSGQNSTTAESAVCALGFCYLQGTGFPQDKIKGLNLLSTAALNGNEEAKKYLEKLNIPLTL
jgi:uncharacterized protein